MDVFSILIVNYKGWNALKDCLDSLIAFSSNRYTLEIIVVDNCSNDGQFEIFTTLFPTVKFILNSGNNGFANGCNVAAKNATSDYYLFLNPDTKVETNELVIFFDHYLKDHNTILSCLQIDEKGNFYKQHNLLPKFVTFFGIPRAIYRNINKKDLAERIKEDETYLYPEWVTGAVVLISKKWFLKVDGWNEDYWMYMEDVDLCKRVLEQNGTIAVLKKATIFHQHGGASRINITTKALTKTEVLISKHTYIQSNFSSTQAFFLHLRLLAGVLLEKITLSIISIPFFTNNKLVVNRKIVRNYLTYLWNALRCRTFVSPRAMNFKRK